MKRFIIVFGEIALAATAALALAGWTGSERAKYEVDCTVSLPDLETNTKPELRGGRTYWLVETDEGTWHVPANACAMLERKSDDG